MGHMLGLLAKARGPVDEYHELTMKDNSVRFVRRERFLGDNTKVLNITTRRGKMPLTELRKARGEAGLGT